MVSDLSQFSDVIIDSFFVVDLDRNIVDFNRSFHSMLPRAVARNLKTKKCYEVMNLDICKQGCIAEQCWKMKRQIRLDEIGGQVAGYDDQYRFILSAIPLFDDQGQLVGAMEVQRNVTDEALVQSKYQRQMEASAEHLKVLEGELKRRTHRLMEVSRRLYDLQQELVKARTDLFG